MSDVLLKLRMEFPRKATSADKRKSMASPAVGIARALAKEIRRRFVKTGKSYRGHRYVYKDTDRVAKSPRYPKVAGGEQSEKTGAFWFASSAVFHKLQNVRLGSFNVSGGMWRGLTVQGSRYALIRFRGRSEGQGMSSAKSGKIQDPHWRYMKGKKRVMARPKKINNAMKAGTVDRLIPMLGGNILRPTAGEVGAVAAGVSNALIALTGSVGVFPNAGKVDWSLKEIGKLTGQTGANVRLRDNIALALSRKGRIARL